MKTISSLRAEGREGHWAENACALGFGPAMKKYVFNDALVLLEGDIRVDGQDLSHPASAAVPPEIAALMSRYRHSGEDFLKSVKGGFRLALWDNKKERLIIAVDSFATRPIYYSFKQGAIAFAPTASSLSQAPAFGKDIDLNVLYFYLNHSFVPAPFSIYRDIKRLEPGQYVVWDGKNLKLRQYWDIQYNEDMRLTVDAAATLVRSAVQNSLEFYFKSQCCEQTEIGAFLSGGTDSSTLVGLLAGMQNTPVKTFSVGFKEEAYNEIGYARLAAKRFGAEGHEYFVSAEDALEAIAILAKSFDEPFGNSSAIPTYFGLRMAKDAGIKVMIAGDGGDELFAGNTRYLLEKYFLPFDLLSKRLQALTADTARRLPQSYPLGKLRRYIERASEPNPDRFYHYQLFVSQNAIEFLTPEFLAAVDGDFPLAPARYHYNNIKSAAALNRLLYMDLKMCIADNDLFKVNRMAEALAIKVSYPYLDGGLAEMTGKIPAAFKLKAFQKRFIFKKAFEKLLPQEILKKKKHGFGLPVAHWLRAHPGFRDMAHSLLLDTSVLQRGYFKRKALEELLCKHDKEPTDYYGAYIWNFMMLELWHRNHRDTLYGDEPNKLCQVLPAAFAN